MWKIHDLYYFLHLEINEIDNDLRDHITYYVRYSEVLFHVYLHFEKHRTYIKNEFNFIKFQNVQNNCILAYDLFFKDFRLFKAGFILAKKYVIYISFYLISIKFILCMFFRFKICITTLIHIQISEQD